MLEKILEEYVQKENTGENILEKGKLYVVPTPIGNLKDITLRALEVLEHCDYILAEDTRNTLKLLNSYNISKKMYSYYKECEEKKKDIIVENLKNGDIVALVSDAGMPGISDPGHVLLKEIIKEGLPFEVLPGACAFVPAIVGSGADTTAFSFYGFLKEKSKTKQKEELENLLNSNIPTIIYEAPHRIEKTLFEIMQIDPQRKVCLCREISKLHEQYARDSVQKIYEDVQNEVIPKKGEMVLVIWEKEQEDNPFNVLVDGKISEELLQKQIAKLEKQGLSKKDIIKKISKENKLTKNDIYMYFV